ncbi:SusC/RagA family TonB-linked outer membrane protein [Robertkochia solimangrovi]|uniref:SusC/RagA family TonB-linked outer membrane protein n=1 Tax=Robertkochia solimangrovi TaxID=2213046 RepID=UPI00117FF7F5|nr:TonB-dependent receptor [Robertkochia solimangrovi]TRZ41977.1 SusC/RagA family TonB-linked outer membrane protein [Robertkochia solimangrovi]
MEINLREYAFRKGRYLLMLCMRTFLILFCTTVFSFTTSSTFSQNAMVKIEKDDFVTMDEVFKLISEQTDYKFIYFEDLFMDLPKVHLKKGAVTVKELLDRAMINGRFEYVFDTENNNLLSIRKSALQEFIKGRITDSKGNPLLGVTVYIKGSVLGTFTDENGEFTIKANPDDVLIFSYIGFENKEVIYSGQDWLDIELKEQVSELESVVLIGYGKQKRKEVTGAVSSVDMKNLQQISVGTAGFDRSLGGLAKGVQVSQNTGRPGAPVRINIRGFTSPLSGSLNQPLYVIDGVPFNIDAMPGTFDGGNNPLLAIAPDDIQSIDILKDAAATSIYGSRGANGVILVSTKQGSGASKPSFEVSYNTSYATPINTLESLNSLEYRNYYDRMIGNSMEALNSGQIYLDFGLLTFGQIDIDFSDFSYVYNGLNDAAFGDADVNWNDEVFRDMAMTQQASVNYSGRTQTTNYRFSISLMDQEGLLINDQFDQYNLRMNLNSKPSQSVALGVTLNGGYNRSISGETSTRTNSGVNLSSVQARPDFPISDEQGNLLPLPDYSYGIETQNPSPLQTLENKNTRNAYNVVGNTYISLTPIKNLTFKGELNGGLFISRSSVFSPKSSMISFGFPNRSTLTNNDNISSNITTNLTADYSVSVGNHRFTALGGYSWDRSKYQTTRHYYRGFPDDKELINASAAEEVISYSDNKTETGINSLFSRLTYNYNDRYNLTFNFRTDTSSKFGPGNKRGYFPSLSGGWNIANESFFANTEAIDNLLLRASIGRVGSANISDFAYLQFFNTGSSDLYAGNTAVIPSNTLPNQQIGWETTEEIDLGLDFSFFGNRLNGSVDFYRRQTTGALAPAPIPLELGPTSYYANLMDVSNEGVEVSLSADLIRSKNFQWNFSVNWSLNRNKLEKLNGANIDELSQDLYEVGSPVGIIKGYEVVKILQTQAEVGALNDGAPDGTYDRQSLGVGDYMFRDLNGDGQITSDDRKVLGSIQPDFFGGFSNSISYKNLSLSAMFQYSVGADATWDMINFQVFNYLGPNYLREYALNTWSPENPDARYAKPVHNDPSANWRTSDRYIYETSYLRMKNIQLTYQFQKEGFLDKIGIDQAALFVSGTNLWTWTKWPGSDPETYGESGIPSITSASRNSDPYPLAKSLSLGINVQF